MLDWGEGTYECTAELLNPVAERCVRAAQVSALDRVLDLGCGTGNAALAAARLGARVVAVDPASRLLEVTRARMQREGLAFEILKGDSSAIPAEDSSFDKVISNFAVIFSEDAERAASELLRVLRPGGRIVLTTWIPRGAIAAAGKILRDAIDKPEPNVVSRPAPRWGDEGFLRHLFERDGAAVQCDEHSMTFEAESAEAWFAEQEANHPVWRTVRRVLAAKPDIWQSIRAQSIECLRGSSEVADRLRVKSPYFVVTIQHKI
jgi:ubiquinone/menaquinone biosynthesis C-methylase UbiE